MSTLTTIEGLNNKEQAVFRRVSKLFSEGFKSFEKGCQEWVSSISDERRLELFNNGTRFQRTILRQMEGVGLGEINPTLLFASHDAALKLMTMPRKEQDKLISEGVPTLRLDEKGVPHQHLLSHMELAQEDLKIAFERKGEAWKVSTRPKQKEKLQAALMDSQKPKEAFKERGWGSVKGDKFYPAPMRPQSGYTVDDLEKAIKLLKGE